MNNVHRKNIKIIIFLNTNPKEYFNTQNIGKSKSCLMEDVLLCVAGSSHCDL